MNIDITDKKKQTILLIILLLITILVRLQTTHQTDFDSYWLHAMGESIQIHKAALWVFHPTSLFGYYPLSYPSGTPFILATTDTLTGLGMNMNILISSIIFGILLSGFTFILTKKFLNSWFASYFAALTISLSPLIINYTAFNAAGRITVLLFVLPFIWTLIKWLEEKKLKYLILAVFLLIFSFFMHRTAQLAIVYILAIIFAIIIEKIPKIWLFIKNHKHYKKHLHPRYEKSKYYVLLDLGILMFIIIIAKISDLIVRGRFGENIGTKIIEPATEIFSAQEKLILIGIIIGAIILITTLILLYLKFFKKKKIIKGTKSFLHKEYHKIFENPQKYFIILLFLIFLIIFVRQFLGQSFYSPSLSEFQETEFLSGDQSYIIFANFVINYTTSVSSIFLLAFVGFVALMFKKTKNTKEWFLLLMFIGLSGVLLDKKYVRMFITPILAIFTGYAIYVIYSYFRKEGILHKTRKSLSYVFLFIVIFLMIAGTFIPYARTTFLGEESSFYDVDWYWETGQYLRSLDCDCSTVTTQELTAGVIIFASSGIPGGSHNIYYFIGRDKLQPESLTFGQVKDKLMSGSKIENLWILPDWIFGGQYYVGKHARYLFNKPFYDEASKIIIEEYAEKFYIHDKNLESNDFLDSIIPVKNIVYDNPKTTVYQIDKGRE